MAKTSWTLANRSIPRRNVIIPNALTTSMEKERQWTKCQRAGRCAVASEVLRQCLCGPWGFDGLSLQSSQIPLDTALANHASVPLKFWVRAERHAWISAPLLNISLHHQTLSFPHKHAYIHDMSRISSSPQSLVEDESVIETIISPKINLYAVNSI